MSPSWDQREFEGRLEILVALLDERVVLNRSAAAFGAAGGIDVAWVGEVAADSALRVDHVHGARTNMLAGLVVPSGWGLTGKAFASRRLQAVDDYFAAGSITHHFDPYIEAEGVRRLIATPVLVDGRIVAVLAGGSRSSGSFGDIALARLDQVAKRTSTALKAAARSQQLAKGCRPRGPPAPCGGSPRQRWRAPVRDPGEPARAGWLAPQRRRVARSG